MTHDLIICVHNGFNDVQACLSSIKRHWSANLSKLIVVDDCSDAETKGLIAEHEQIIENMTVITLDEQHFYTKSANIGLKASSAEIRTLLNSDTIVTAGWSDSIRRVFETSDFIGVVGTLSNAASTQSLPFIKSSAQQTAVNSLPPDVSVDEFAEFVRVAGMDRLSPYVPLVHGFCLSIRGSVFETIGYFDEAAFPNGYGEENDFCFRADDAGFVLAIAIDTFIFHAKSKSYTSNEERIAYMNSGMANFAAKHGADRIKLAVQFMEDNPHLQYMRDRVLDRWPEHYSA